MLHPQDWTVDITRPGDGAPSISLGATARSEALALIKALERYPDHAVGTTVHVRPKGVAWQHYTAAYERTAHVWDRTYPKGEPNV